MSADPKPPMTDDQEARALGALIDALLEARNDRWFSRRADQKGLNIVAQAAEDQRRAELEVHVARIAQEREREDHETAMAAASSPNIPDAPALVRDLKQPPLFGKTDATPARITRPLLAVLRELWAEHRTACLLALGGLGLLLFAVRVWR